MSGATSTTYAKLDKPELGGSRLIWQMGEAKFVSSAAVLSLSTRVQTVRYFKATYRTGSPAKGSGIVLFSSGTISGNKLIVSRATVGKLSGAYINYEIIGLGY